MSLAITGHWLNDNWDLEEALIEFQHQPGSHSGVCLGDAVFHTINKFGITEKLFCITTDNTSNNGTLMKHLSRRLKDELGVKWDPLKHHIGCLNHIINLAVQDFLKSIKGLALAVEIDHDDDSEDSDGVDGEVPADGFEIVMHEIRTITKVRKM